MQTIPELRRLEKLISAHRDLLRVDVPTLVGPGEGYPIYVLELGRADDTVPAVAFIGGIHGNEQIGTQVVLAFLESLLEQLHWDVSMQEQLQHMRLIFMPLVNPTGMAMNRRSTGRGIDLMRNAPVDSASAHWLLGGQRISRHLPWFRGRKGELAPENMVLIDTIRRRLLNAPLSIALDCHSGFGYRDSIWFPYAHTRQPIPNLAEIFALRNQFRRTYPNHTHYRIEPQCRHYMTHGDVWDYLYMESLQNPERSFLPLTLEMGSWLWVRKNPRQIFSRLGLFNPIEPHRLSRILRQHLLWCDFLLRATRSYQNWLPVAPHRSPLQKRARKHWESHYQDPKVMREKHPSMHSTAGSRGKRQ